MISQSLIQGQIQCQVQNQINKLIFFLGILLQSEFLAANSSTKQDSHLEIIKVTPQEQLQSINYVIIKRKDFINRSQTVADILQNINGIQIRQISGIGNPSAISIRGSTSKQVQVYIDGQLLNDSLSGNFDLNQISVEQIDNIVISKQQSQGLGITPIGGAIYINTYNNHQDMLRLSTSLGSLGLQQFNLTSNHNYQNQQLGIGYHYIDTDNDYSYLVPQDFNAPSTSIQQPLKNNQYRKNTWYVKDSIQFQHHQIHLDLQHLKQIKGLANYQNNSPENHSRLEDHTDRFGYQHLWEPSHNTGYNTSDNTSDSIVEQIEWQFYQQKKREHYQYIPGGPIERIANYQSKQQIAHLKANIQHNTWQLTPFLNYQKQTFTSRTEINGQVSRCNGISTCDVVAQQQQTDWGTHVDWQPQQSKFSSTLMIAQSLQVNDNHPVDEPENDYMSSNNRYTSSELSLLYGDETVNSQLSFARGIRAPTLFELFGDRGSFKGNEDLAAETANSISVGLASQTEHHATSMTLYQQHQKQAIVPIFNSTGVGSYDNVSRSITQGIELQLDYRFSQKLHLLLQGHYIDSQTQSDIVAFNNKKLPGIFHRQFSIGIKYQFTPTITGQFRTDLDQQLYFNRSNRFENSNDQGNGSPTDRVLSHLNLQWKINNYTLDLAIQNLFNQDYLDLANRSAQGRTIQIKLSIEVF